MAALYSQLELGSVPSFFRSKYGVDECPPEMTNIWRLALTGQIHRSYTFFASNFAYVADKRGEATLLKPFVGQAILRYTLDSQLRAQLPGRICEIKARQVGWTVENIARALHFCLDENRQALILVDDEEVAQEQARRLGTMLNGLPQFLQPKRRIQNLKHLIFDNPNPKDRIRNPGLASQIQITVPSSFRGVGGSICVIISEYAHMQAERQNEIQMGLVSALPQTPYTILVYDTTPNGFDDSYYPMAIESAEENPKWCKKIENWKGELRAEDVMNGILGVPDCVEHGYPGILVPAMCPWRLHEEYCMVAGSLIATETGLRPIEEIKPGDKTPYGEVSETYIFKDRKVVRVTTETGRSLVCSENHPLWTPDGWVEARDILGKEVKPEPHQFPSEYQIVDGISITNEVGRLLGYFMADGSITREGSISFACDQRDQDVVEDIRSLLTGLRERIHPRPCGKGNLTPPRADFPIKPFEHGYSKCTYVRSQRYGFVSLFEKLGAYDPVSKKRKVCIPKVIMQSPKGVIKNFLMGLFEGDGWSKRTSPGIDLGSKHVALLRDVQLLLLSFGIRCRVIPNNRTLRGKKFQGWRIYVRVTEAEKFSDIIGFVSARKQSLKRTWRRDSNRIAEPELEKVTSVESAGKADVYDICIPGAHQYVANGILVHNSARSRTTPRGELRPMTKTQRAETESSLGKVSRYGGEEELDLRDRFGVCLERLWWRRRKIDGYKFPSEEGKLLTFRQEFMTTIEGAFVDSGGTPFDRAAMDALARQERPPIARGLFIEEDKFDHHSLNTTWHEVRIFAPPQPGEKYTMGIDTDIAYESPDSDATVATVVRFSDRKVVCVYEARVPSHLLIEQLYCIYKWYFNAYYAIETAGMGYDLVRRCIDRGMGNCHYYKRYDADYPEPTKFPGWETNKITRPFMDQTLTEMLCHRNPESGKAEPLFNVPDAKTIQEIRGLSRTNSGSFKSSRGKDDHVDALDIALCIALDPYSGLIRHEQEVEEKKREEFESSFKWFTQGRRDRNRPTLAEL